MTKTQKYLLIAFEFQFEKNVCQGVQTSLLSVLTVDRLKRWTIWAIRSKSIMKKSCFSSGERICQLFSIHKSRTLETNQKSKMYWNKFDNTMNVQLPEWQTNMRAHWVFSILIMNIMNIFVNSILGSNYLRLRPFHHFMIPPKIGFQKPKALFCVISHWLNPITGKLTSYM